MPDEFKPGDVAMVTVRTTYGIPEQEQEFLAMFDGREWNRADGEPPVVPSHVGFPWEMSIRRLVVIDPEDREQVERFLTALRSTAFKHGVGYVNLSQMFANEQHAVLAAALREFANPTPPSCAQALVLDYGDSGGTYLCLLDAGHEGPHADTANEVSWTAKP